jgi:hypothetical protein
MSLTAERKPSKSSRWTKCPVGKPMTCRYGECSVTVLSYGDIGDGCVPKVTKTGRVSRSTTPAAAFTILARYPHLFNYPVRVTPENAPRLYRSGRLLLRWLNVVLTWVFAFIEWQTLQVALGKATGLPEWFLPMTIALVVLVPISVVAFTAAWMFRR